MGRIVFCDEAGRRSEAPLSRAAALPFERAMPIRIPKSHHGKRGMVGHAFFSTSGQVVVFDSKIEMENVFLLDFDSRFTALAGQPLRVETPEWQHVPDFFARRRDGGAQVFDVKSLAEQDEPDNQLVFSRMETICGELGWRYQVLSEIGGPFRRNLMLLAGFRREAFDPGGLAQAIVEACSTPITIGDLGQLHSVRAIVRPLVLHLLWRRELACDLEVRVLDRETLVWAAEGASHGV